MTSYHRNVNCGTSVIDTPYGLTLISQSLNLLIDQPRFIL